MNQPYTIKSLSPRNNPAWTQAKSFEEAQEKAADLKASGHIAVRIFPNVEAIVTKPTTTTAAKQAVPA